MKMNMNIRDVDEFDSDEFRYYTLEGNWEEVARIYRTHKRARKTKIDGDRGTALHVAVNDGLEYIVKILIDIIINDVDEGGEDGLEHVLKLKNERRDTPLHLAASRGFKNICKLIIGQNGERKHLIEVRNESRETPLFLAALSWQKQTFAYLFKHFLDFENDPVNLQVLIRDHDGDTILHSAIRREFFDLAVIIINYCPKLHDIQNKKGMTPLKILANRPSAFRSGSILTWWRRITYHCIFVPEIDAEETLERYYIKEDKPGTENLQFPENYRTCYEFFISWFAGKLGLGTCKIVSKNKGSDGRSARDEHINIDIPLPSPQPETSQSHASEKIKQSLVPPNYATCSLSLKSAYLYVLGLTGAGVKEMRKIKKKHIWGGQLLSALMKTPSQSYMGSGGQPIDQNEFEYGDEDKDETNPLSVVFDQKEEEEAKKKKQNDTDTKQEQQQASDEKTDPNSEEEIDIKETAFLIAAKNGIVEMVRMILSKIPSAIHDTTTDKKNVFHMAIKNRQPLVVETLVKSLSEQNIKNMIEAVDKDENTVLHLAAEQLSNETPWKIPGSAMQMMWDITWFQYIKKHVPEHFVFRRNKRDKTSGELFKSNHKELVKESSEWLKETSESCSVVAALIAGVSFATSGTVPGGTDNGKPLLEDKPAFKAFAISSLVGLCFSVTALIMFLSILTSRKQAKDFRRSLPLKLLLGLTSLFISIIALFVSFCTGHFFVLKDKYRQYVFPIYIATCLPVTFYAIAQFPLYLDLLRAIIRKVPLPSDRGDGL